jgi:hypothetical protein
MPRTLNSSRPDRVGGVVDRSPEVERDPLLRELVGDVGRVPE